MLSNSDVDCIVVVKNKDFEYKDDPSKIVDARYSFCHVKEDLGVGYCKNVCLKHLMKNSCDHLFLIEDDISILKDDVFKKFIDTAKAFNIGHMNYNNLPTVENNPTYTIVNGNDSVDISLRLCGCFSYFSFEALQYCGLINDRDYVNALEHAEHAYRFSVTGFAPPFFAFPGIHDCRTYLQDNGTATTINKDSQQYSQRLHDAFEAFKKTYGRMMGTLPKPTIDEVKKFFANKISKKANK